MVPQVKTILQRVSLHPFGDDLLQKLATVYVDGAEYRVLAPPEASGDALEWLPHCSVRIPNPESFGSEIVIVGAEKVFIIDQVKGELVKRQEAVAPPSSASQLKRPKLSDPLPRTKSGLQEEMEYWTLHQNDGEPGSFYWQSVDARLIQLRHLDLTVPAGQNFHTASHRGLPVFISHSSQDEKLARALIDLLRSGIGLQNNEIRCTSVDGHRLPIGVNSEAQLREEVKAASVVVGLITLNSLASYFVMFELGARWGSERFLAPLLAGVSVGELQQPIGLLNALRADNISQLHQLVSDIARELKRQPQEPASYSIELAAVQELAATASRRLATTIESKTTPQFDIVEGRYYRVGSDNEMCPRCAAVENLPVPLLDMNIDGRGMKATCPQCKTAIGNRPPVTRSIR